MIDQLNPCDFADWRQRAALVSPTATPAARPLVLDVREPWELQTASIREDGFELLHIPMREVPARLDELKARGLAHPIAVLCHHGMRSYHTATLLAENGFTQVVNLAGGIDAWSQQVDASIPTY